MKVKTIIKSFKKIGMIPENNFHPRFLPLFPFEQTLLCCPKYSEFQPNEIQNIKDNLGKMVEIFGRTGELKESDMDNLGIINSDDVSGINRVSNDLRVQHQQRAICLTLKASVERRRQWLLEREKKSQKIQQNKEERKERTEKKKREREEKREGRKRKREEEKEMKRETKRIAKELQAEKRREERELKQKEGKEREERRGEKYKSVENIPPVQNLRKSVRQMELATKKSDENPRRKRKKTEGGKGRGGKKEKRGGDKSMGK